MGFDGRLRDEISSYYDTVSRYIELELEQRDDGDFWSRILSRAERPDVLDLGCGTGRITEILASGSSSVVGVDLSREMLLRARLRFADRSNVHLILADMRTLRLAHRFRLVVMANDPFTHLVEDEDRDQALRTVVEHLDPDEGRFVLDGFWLGEERLEKAATAGGFRRDRVVEAPDRCAVRIREWWRCDRTSRTCRVRFEYAPVSPRDAAPSEGEEVVASEAEDPGPPLDHASFRARLWTVEEVRRRFDDAGLRVESVLGGFDRRPFDPESASNLIVEAAPASS